MKFYFTHDMDGEFIAENADIKCVEADSEEIGKSLVRKALEERNSDIIIEGAILHLQEGIFGDCWIKTGSDPTISKDDFFIFEPFSLDEIIVHGPGQNPGVGNQYWITPAKTVFVAGFDFPEE